MRALVGQLVLGFLIVVGCFALCVPCQAQQDRIKPNDELPTNATSTKPAKDPMKQGPKKPRRVRYIIRSTPRGTLSGDRCAQSVTRRLGFEFMVMPKGQPGNKTNFDRLVHNFGVKMYLLRTKGPFWRLAMNSRLKKCRIRSGELR